MSEKYNLGKSSKPRQFPTKGAVTTYPKLVKSSKILKDIFSRSSVSKTKPEKAPVTPTS